MSAATREEQCGPLVATGSFEVYANGSIFTSRQNEVGTVLPKCITDFDTAVHAHNVDTVRRLNAEMTPKQDPFSGHSPGDFPLKTFSRKDQS